jgi:hypothetical protein
MSDLEARLHHPLDPLLAEGYLPGYAAAARVRLRAGHRGGRLPGSESGAPMRTDAVLWIASLSKPVGTRQSETAR